MCQTLFSPLHWSEPHKYVWCSAQGLIQHTYDIKGPNPGVHWPILSVSMKGTVGCPPLTPDSCLRLLKILESLAWRALVSAIHPPT